MKKQFKRLIVALLVAAIVSGTCGGMTFLAEKEVSAASEAQYSYSIKVINAFCDIYTDNSWANVLLYIETENPDRYDFSIDITNTAGEEFSTTTYSLWSSYLFPDLGATNTIGNTTYDYSWVDGGYIVEMGVDTAGEYIFSVVETIDDKYVDTGASTPAVTIQDYEEARIAWVQGIIEESGVDDDSLTNAQKIQTLCSYLKQNYRYPTNNIADGGSYIYLWSEYGTAWQKMQLESANSPALVIDIATNYLGIDGVVNGYAYSGNYNYHAYVVYDGVYYTACNLTSTGYLDADTIEVISMDSIEENTGNHSYGEGTVVQEASCEQEGVIVYTCTRCGNEITESIEKQHSWVINTATEISGSGTKETVSRECSVCNKSVSLVNLAGTTRYNTASAIVDEVFESCTYAVITTGTDFPDALAAASLAGALDAPVIITNDANINVTLSDLDDLGVTDFYIVGGTSSVSSDVETAIENAGISVERVCGSNRRETAIAVAQKLQEIDGTSDTCFVATGRTYADVLCASAYAYYSSSPIFLTKNDGTITEDVIEAIEEGGYTNIIILGGESSVTAETEGALAEIASVVRLGGSDRYETSTLIAEWSVENGMSYDNVTIAAGTIYPDALSASSLCGQYGSVMLLTAETANGEKTLDALTENTDDISTVYVIGGENTISSALKDLIVDALS